ncbi:MAG: amidohydrolase family protein [Acidimicrobiales bacterium]
MGRIDTHHHVVPPPFADWLRAKGALAGGLPIPGWSPDAALAVMERHGVDVSILSVSTPGVFLGDGVDARSMARDVNDFAAQVVRDHPDRFGFFATLTLPDVDGALAELDRAFDGLGADGVVLLANSGGSYLGDKAFDPVFDELQRRQAVVFVHPSILPGLEPIEGIPAFVADFLLDTTRAAVNLARTGTLDRCPDVRFVLSHAGGFVPYAASRLATAAGDGDFLTGLTRLRRYHFDIALSGTPSALPSLLAFTTPDKVTFGTDFPYAPDTAVAAMTSMYEAYDLDEAARHQIDRGTAETLFPRFARSAA